MLKQDLTVLDAVLGHRQYVSGSSASQADSALYDALIDKLPNGPSNVVRWAQHMATYSAQQRQLLPQHTDLQSCGDTQAECQLKQLLQKVALSAQSRTQSRRVQPADCCKGKSTDGKATKTESLGHKIVLKTAKGTRDYHPPEMAVRRTVFDKIKAVFDLHGAVEIETPVFELKDVLTGKYGEDSKLIYDLEDQGGEMLALRYDLTVPFARYMAQHKLDNMSRYHIARVYRRDSPSMARGRYREFYQCDFDIAGTYEAMLPDAHCVQVIDQVLSSLNLGQFTIRVNHRKLLDGLFGACGVPASQFRCICSAVDKLDKETWEAVRTEMVQQKGLDEAVADRIGQYVKLNSKDHDLFQVIRNDPLLKDNDDIKTAMRELEVLCRYTALLQCDAHVVLDMSLARGLDYYTGVIFEAVLQEPPRPAAAAAAAAADKGKKKKKPTEEEEEEEEDGGTVGSVAGGGRYDNLVGMFDQKNRTVPCVGVSFGIERLFAIQQRKMKESQTKMRSSMASVYVAGVCKGMLEERLKLCAMLHAGGIRTQVSHKLNPKFLTQLQYAEDNGIPLVAVVGESEVADGVVNVRHTVSRKESKVPRDQLVEHLRKLID